MSNPPVQAQWNLSSTVGSAVTIPMGLLGALNSDSVQPLAYLACEKFGATLAISPNTILKIESAVVPPTTPTAIAFLWRWTGQRTFV
ncbi:hypothetical protein IMZ48_11895 [Candidatus Bathyarchaeota archaeon]|nr:hypothetical protein [Candidatus Bathyarchaeota archaeon]